MDIHIYVHAATIAHLTLNNNNSLKTSSVVIS